MTYVICLLALVFSAAAASAQTYACPMHPGIIASAAGTCSECGMELVRTRGTPIVIESKRTSRFDVSRPVIRRFIRNLSICIWIVQADGNDSTAEGERATHRVMVRVLDQVTGRPSRDVDVWFHMTDPDGRNLMPHLAARGDYHIGAVRLVRRGTYTFMAHVIGEDRQDAVVFRYLRHRE